MNNIYFLQAKKLLEEKGWCRLQWENEKGEHCVAGALEKVAGYRASWRAIKFLENILTQLAQQPTYLSQWNDEPGRTKEEVLELLEIAAATSGFFKSSEEEDAKIS